MKTEEYFDARARGWTGLYIEDARFRRRFTLVTTFLDRVLPKKPGSLLDAGCGSGVFSRYLASHGWKVTAIDASPEMIEEARMSVGDNSIEYSVSTIEEFEAKPKSFDAILSLSILEYVEDDEAVIGKLISLLAEGGVLVVSVPNRAGLLRKLEGLIFGIRSVTRDRVFGSRGEYLKYQKRQYSPFELDIMMRQFGLRKKRGIYVNSGFAGPSCLLPFFERRWWAAMYCAAYRRKYEL